MIPFDHLDHHTQQAVVAAILGHRLARKWCSVVGIDWTTFHIELRARFLDIAEEI